MEAISQLICEYPKVFKNIIFVIGGKGNISSYEKLINNIPAKYLNIRNYILSNNEFDDILKKSIALVLPYKNGTQTGNIQVAYYSRCPVIISNVGSLSELVNLNSTGLIVSPNSVQELKDSILWVIKNTEVCLKMGDNAFEYYKNELK